MEVYVDDMLVKSKITSDHVTHLSDTFNILRMYCVKLNPLKCTFSVASEKLFGFMVNQRDIETS